MEAQNIPFLSAGSTFFGLLIGLPVATVMGIGMPTAALAQAQPEAPFTEAELEPIEAEIEESIPPALEDSRSTFNIWSEDEYDVFESDDFRINTDYETDFYDEQPGPADGGYLYGADDINIGDDPFNRGDRESELTP
ncbi:hypothetical protein C7293_11530 [filamentous cyanobacterium CCT1]|nr:hypothetical protein C7293_11530 [filamentous cyanobacterium CCT1]PSN79184.1 hypothetical protein C8B47_12965 [filamentous cyanobacterium CCP4]